MDFCKLGGFARLDMALWFAASSYICTSIIHNHMEPRTAIHMILSLIPGGMLLVGPDCSSWSVVSRGSSWRTVMNWHGNMTRQFVVRANLMIARLLVCNIETSSSGLKHLLGGAWPLQADFDLSISAMCGMPLRVRATIGFREGICETYQI